IPRRFAPPLPRGTLGARLLDSPFISIGASPLSVERTTSNVERGPPTPGSFIRCPASVIIRPYADPACLQGFRSAGAGRDGTAHGVDVPVSAGMGRGGGPDVQPFPADARRRAR